MIQHAYATRNRGATEPHGRSEEGVTGVAHAGAKQRAP